MKPNQYRVTFRYFEIQVSAFNVTEAIILAQSEAIKAARDYTVVSVEEI